MIRFILFIDIDGIHDLIRRIRAEFFLDGCAVRFHFAGNFENFLI